ncbi:MAG: anthranilate phosphoribosyltransferase [Silvanigrellales bacterium]|jgi:anthranilate phosphoribosyltransferase|nr:anthranilate phosphoribosyltransferase [Silvanigrellales bacterium]
MIIDKSFSPFMEQVFSERRLSRDDVGRLLDAMIDGTMSDVRVAAVLTGLRFVPFGQDIVLGALHAVLRHTERGTPSSEALVDCSGTGGDGSSTVNISTMAAVVAAAAGARVAKFGSRSVTSKCGSADVLEAQGVHLSTSLAEVDADLTRAGISFLYAPAFYPQLRHISQVRRSLGFHTLFDVLVPMANPLPLTGQLLGVYSKDLQVVVGRCLVELGRKRALVVHSDEGLDEISVCGPTQVLKVQGTLSSVEIWRPQDFGLQTRSLSDLRGGGIEENARAFTAVLDAKEPNGITDAVLLNAAGVLWCAGLCDDLSSGLEQARAALVSGKARALFDSWRSLKR